MGRAGRAVGAHIPQQVERGWQCHRRAGRSSGGGGMDAVMAMPRVESNRIEREGGREVAARSLARRMCCAVLCCAVLCCPAPSPLPRPRSPYPARLLGLGLGCAPTGGARRGRQARARGQRAESRTGTGGNGEALPVRYDLRGLGSERAADPNATLARHMTVSVMRSPATPGASENGLAG